MRPISEVSRDFRGRSCVELSRARLPYFFLGPLLTIGGLGLDLVVLLPPRLDIAHLSEICGS
jgi:hypothetical protein